MKTKPIANNSPRFAILARVSTRDQLDGYSLDRQEQQGREYVKKVGGTVRPENVYVGQESGRGTVEEREVLKRLLADAERGMFDALVIQDTSRLARNTIVMGIVRDKLVRLGISFHNFSGPLSFDTPAGKLNSNIQAAFGEYFVEESVVKSVDSREYVMRSGRPAAGRPPYGRRWDGEQKKLVVIPARQVQLKLAYDLIVKQGRSLISAAAQLGIGQSSLRKAISSAANTQVIQHLGGQEYSFPCPALLSELQRERLEMCLAANAVVRRGMKGEYLLQGMVRCSGCSGTMTGQTSTKDGRRYSIYRHPTKTYKEGCTWGVPVELLDADALRACADVVGDGDNLLSALRAAIAQDAAGASEIINRIAVMDLRIAETKKRHANETDSLASFPDKGPTKERLVLKVRATERILTDQIAERELQARQLGVVQLPKGGADAIAAKLRTLYWRHGVGAQVLSFAQRREFVRIIVGRMSKESSEGIFVTMSRPTGGSKKNVYWRYRLQGSVALVDGVFDHYHESPYSGSAPELREVRVPTREQIKRLAALAASSGGIYTPPRNVQSRMKRS